jgi:dihydroorotate dehydrogenase
VRGLGCRLRLRPLSARAALFNLGFSWVEIGSVTPKAQVCSPSLFIRRLTLTHAQPGNPKPRVFRLDDDDALINRYGFPSTGHAAVLARLRARVPAFAPASSPDAPAPASQRPGALLAVNLGKNKASAAADTADYVAGVHAFAPHADVLVINVSSPNTPGLRALQQRDALRALLADVVRARDEAPRRPRLVLKVAPDLDAQALKDVGEAVRAVGGVDGVIVSNTTVQRPTGLAGGASCLSSSRPLASSS